MPTVEIFTRPMCGFCHRAKKILDSKGVAYAEYDVWADGAKKAEMVERSGGRNTMPQVFIDGEHVGDSGELAELNASGKLDELLKGAA